MTDKDYIKGNDRNYVILMMLVCFVSGLIAGKIFASIVYSNKQTPIYYISQEEILELEKQRAKDQGEGLFYGKTSEVLCASYSSPPLRQVRSPLHSNFFA